VSRHVGGSVVSVFWKEIEEMSSVTVDEVFDKIEDAKIKKMRTNWTAYKDILVDLAQGNEVDPVEVGIVLDMVECNREQLKQDVEKMKRRLEWHATAQAKPARQTAMDAAGRDYEAAVAEYKEATSRLGAIVSAKRSAMTQAEMLLGLSVDAENRLVQNCDDPSILHEEQQITRKRFEVIQKRREILELLDLNNTGSPGRQFYSVQAEIEKLRGKIESQSWIHQPGVVSERERKIAALESRLDTMRPGIDELRQKVADCDRELNELNEESAELRQRKLQP
jgi:predicted RNase H-like nuclease (RuvC/YqgF family)